MMVVMMIRLDVRGALQFAHGSSDSLRNRSAACALQYGNANGK